VYTRPRPSVSTSYSPTIIDHPYILSTAHTFLYYQLSTTGKIPGCKCARS